MTEANGKLAALRQELKKPLAQRKSKTTLRNMRRELIMYNLGARDNWPQLPEPQEGTMEEVARLEENRATAGRVKFGGWSHAEARS